MNTDLQIESQVEVLLKTVFKGDSDVCEDSKNDKELQTDNDNNLDSSDDPYDLLNIVPSSRKLMNYLFSEGTFKTPNTSNGGSNIVQKCVDITEEWYVDEKRSGSQMSSSVALQLEAPVLFSWSNSNKTSSSKDSIRRDQKDNENNKVPRNLTKSATTTSDKYMNSESTNSKLFDIVFEELGKMPKSNITWHELLKGNDSDSSDQMNGVDDSDVEREVSLKEPRQSTFNNSAFKVDPLEKFVARQLPKPKKEYDIDDLKKKHKLKKKARNKRSIFGFWSNKKTSKESKCKPSSVEDHNDNEESSKFSTIDSKANVETGRNGNLGTNSGGENELEFILDENESEHHYENSLLDLDNNTGESDQMVPSKQIICEPTLNSALNNNQIQRNNEMKEIDINDSHSNAVCYENVDDNEEESDNDFGEFGSFVASSYSEIHSSIDVATNKLQYLFNDGKNGDSISEKDKTPESKTAMPIPIELSKNEITMNSFVPLQPKKA